MHVFAPVLIATRFLGFDLEVFGEDFGGSPFAVVSHSQVKS